MTVLIVDDSPRFRELIRSILTDLVDGGDQGGRVRVRLEGHPARHAAAAHPLRRLLNDWKAELTDSRYEGALR
jgi:CheY-like chemotaxis protein